jgi:hypothetical protein
VRILKKVILTLIIFCGHKVEGIYHLNPKKKLMMGDFSFSPKGYKKE